MLKADVPDVPYDPRISYGGHDILYGKKDGKLTRVIECGLPVNYPNPGCSHSFILNDAEIKISYRLGFLHDWKAIEDKARAFFSAATIGHADNLKPYCHEKL